MTNYVIPAFSSLPPELELSVTVYLAKPSPIRIRVPGSVHHRPAIFSSLPPELEFTNSQATVFKCPKPKYILPNLSHLFQGLSIDVYDVQQEHLN